LKKETTMKRKPRTSGPAREKACAELSPLTIKKLAAHIRKAMYSQGFPGHPIRRAIRIPQFTIYGQDAISLSEIDGTKFKAKREKPRKRRAKG
jgi:hypothetical protein